MRSLASTEHPVTLRGALTSVLHEDSIAGCFVALIGGFFAMIFFVLPLWRVAQARDWVSVPCVIHESRLGESHDRDGSIYRVEVRYRYRFPAGAEPGTRGPLRESTRYDMMNGIYSGGVASKQRIVDSLPRGSHAKCWVDPRHPDQAVMERGMTLDMCTGSVVLIFPGIGLWIIWSNTRMKISDASVPREISSTHDTAVQTRVAALRGARALARHEALAFLVRGLRHPNEEVQVAAITSIEALRLREAFEPMLSHADATRTAAVHDAAARALEASACVEDEALLLRTLCAASQSGEVRMAAARALGAVGTGRAVETLRTVAGGVFSGAPGRAANKAIGQIQSRLDGASAGQLSVADATGDLSFAQEAGSLCFCGVSARGPRGVDRARPEDPGCPR